MPDNLESRVAAIESVLGVESALRAAGDVDLSDLTLRVQAMNALLRALASTQAEHGVMLRAHGAKLDRILTILEGKRET